VTSVQLGFSMKVGSVGSPVVSLRPRDGLLSYTQTLKQRSVGPALLGRLLLQRCLWSTVG